jgi:hypothetical protein
MPPVDIMLPGAAVVMGLSPAGAFPLLLPIGIPFALLLPDIPLIGFVPMDGVQADRASVKPSSAKLNNFFIFPLENWIIYIRNIIIDHSPSQRNFAVRHIGNSAYMPGIPASAA